MCILLQIKKIGELCAYFNTILKDPKLMSEFLGKSITIPRDQ
jgi:hypothetical protein